MSSSIQAIKKGANLQGSIEYSSETFECHSSFEGLSASRGAFTKHLVGFELSKNRINWVLYDGRFDPNSSQSFLEEFLKANALTLVQQTGPDLIAVRGIRTDNPQSLPFKGILSDHNALSVIVYPPSVP